MPLRNFMKKKGIKKILRFEKITHKTKYFIIVILVTLIGLWPFFRKGFFESHDGEWMIIRFTAFHQTLRSGQIPVRFVDRLNNNYGYPVLNFLYPLPFYFSELPKIVGFNFTNSIKITFVISTLMSTVIMFWALSQTFSKEASLAGSILYLFIPYRFVDLYVRGSLGENFAFAIVPLVLGFILKLEKDNEIFLAPLALSIALLILSHNVIAALFIPVFLVLILLKVKSKIKALLSVIAGVAISTFFWLPAIYDLQFVKYSQVKISQISEHLVSFGDLILPRWGYGPRPQTTSGLSTQIGLVAIIVILTTAYLLIKKRKKSKVAWFLIILIFVSGFLMTKASSWFWQNMPYVDVTQFPWRLLSVIVFASAFLTAKLVSLAKDNKFLVFFIIVASFITTIFYTKPSNFIERPDSFYSTNESTTTVQDEYMPIWVKDKPQGRANQKIEVANATLSQEIIKPTKYQSVVNAKKDTDVTVNSVYFPGWQAAIDGKPAAINYQNRNGLIDFKLPNGVHKVIIEYKNSGIHLVSEVISILALILTGIYFIYIRSQNTENR